jgi:hypothetical protein
MNPLIVSYVVYDLDSLMEIASGDQIRRTCDKVTYTSLFPLYSMVVGANEEKNESYVRPS